MATYSVTFDEVSQIGRKSGKCAVCGKQTNRQQKFFQTLNPYNKNKDGNPKSRTEIYAELREQIAEWKKEPIVHAKCES